MCPKKKKILWILFRKSAAAMGLKVTDEQELKSETQVKSQATADQLLLVRSKKFWWCNWMLKGMTLPIIIGIVIGFMCYSIRYMAVIAGPKLLWNRQNKIKERYTT